MKVKLNQVMSPDLIYVFANEEVLKAYDKMKSAQVRHLPVVDDDGNVAGIISDRDFQRAMWPIGAIKENEKSITFRAGAVVADYMSSPVKAVDSEVGLSSVIKLMINEKISSVLVTKSHELVGIVTYEDLLMILDSILERPQSLKDKMLEWAYNSPIGQVINLLANSGL